MNDPVMAAFDTFADAVEARLSAMRDEIRRELLLEIRSVPVVAPESTIEVREGPPGRDGEPGKDGTDGIGIRSVEQRGGDLILTMSDGTEHNAGRIVGDQGERGEPGPQGEQGERGEAGTEGRQGDPGPQGERGESGLDGRDGEPGPQGERGETGERGTDGIAGRDGDPGPAGERGADGVDGRDGAPGERGERGEDGIASREEIETLVEDRVTDVQTRTLADTYREVWKAGEQYRRGQTVTWGGSLFLALADTKGKPTETPDWRQITKAGRPGRDAR